MSAVYGSEMLGLKTPGYEKAGFLRNGCPNHPDYRLLQREGGMGLSGAVRGTGLAASCGVQLALSV